MKWKNLIQSLKANDLPVYTALQIFLLLSEIRCRIMENAIKELHLHTHDQQLHET
jgi:hypothetical protein